MGKLSIFCDLFFKKSSWSQRIRLYCGVGHEHGLKLDDKSIGSIKPDKKLQGYSEFDWKTHSTMLQRKSHSFLQLWWRIELQFPIPHTLSCATSLCPDDLKGLWSYFLLC